MKSVPPILLCVVMCLGCLISAEAQTVSGKPVVVAPAVVTVENAAGNLANADGEMPSAAGQRRLTMRERRDLGITWANCFSKAKELYQAGEITADMSRAEIAATVFSSIAADNPTAFADPQIDWDSILAFIEKILPLILQLIGIFS